MERSALPGGWREILSGKGSSGPIRTTKELENIVFHSYPKKLRHGRIHPATRTFQALRIAVNGELSDFIGINT